VDTNYLALSHGGTNASLTASNGGIVYSSSTSLAILSANANSGLALVSGGAGAPSWFAPTQGSILFAGANGALTQDNSNFFWDDTNNRLGIGTASPSARMEVNNGTFLVNNPANPTLAGTYNTSGSAQEVYVSGKYAYVADSLSGLQIIDVSNPNSPTLTGTYNTSGSAYGIYVSGKYAYVADGSSGLQIIDVSNPNSPTLAGTYNTSGSAFTVYISGKYAYVTEGSTGIEIIDISDPSNPILAGYYDGYYTMGIYVSGKYAYIAEGDGGFAIINISDPSNPTLTGSYDTGDFSTGVYVSGKYAYITNGGTILIINVSNPASPTLAGTYNGYSYGQIYVSGKYAYMTDGTGLKILDVSNPASPTLAGSYNTSGSAFGIYVSGKYAYVGDGSAGLQIIDILGANIYAAHIGNIESQNITVTENIDVGNNLYVRSGLNVGQGGILTDGMLSVSGASYFGGNIGIGTTSPTAFLHITAPTTSSASLRLEASSAVDPSSPNIGDLWFNGTNLYFRKDGSTSVDLLASSSSIDGSGATNAVAYWSDSNTLTYETYLDTTRGGTGIDTSALTGVPYITSGTWSVDTNYLALSHGGTNASLTASNGGIVYSSSTSLAILSANANSGLALVSGGAGAPSWFAPTQGSILFAGANGALTQDNSNFFWDDTNNRLGIGTTSPLDMLDIFGTGNALRLSYDLSNYATLSADNTGKLTVNSSSTGSSAITIGSGAAEDTLIIYNGNARDYHIGIDDTDDILKIGLGSTLGTNNFLNIDSDGNIGVNTTSFGTSAANVLAIVGSTAPTTSITDGIQLFAVDGGSGSHELQVRNEAGIVTTISPHNFSIIGSPSEELAWSFYSEMNGKAINVDMTKAIRLIEKLTGEKLIYLKNLNTGKFYEEELNYDPKLLALEELEEQEKNINVLKLGTDQNAATLKELQASIDKELAIVGNELNKINAEIDNQKIRLAALESQLEEIDLELINNEVKVLMEFMLAIGADEFIKLDEIATGNILLDGMLEADKAVAGAFAVKISDESSATIGKAVICGIIPVDKNNDDIDDCSNNPIPTDRDDDGLDDKTGDPMPKDENSDWIDDDTNEPIVTNGREVVVDTEAVGANSRIFVTPRNKVTQPLYVIEIREGESFKVEVGSPIDKDITFDWWIVEEVAGEKTAEVPIEN
jgi:hypothetical protein